jgi:hypothetical protein
MDGKNFLLYTFGHPAGVAYSLLVARDPAAVMHLSSTGQSAILSLATTGRTHCPCQGAYGYKVRPKQATDATWMMRFVGRQARTTPIAAQEMAQVQRNLIRNKLHSGTRAY